MYAVILAGGLGTRLSEETTVRPKPMVEIGGRPILWHLMKNLSEQGVTQFVLCLGYKGGVIREYFKNLHDSESSFTIDLRTGRSEYHRKYSEPWEVTLLETGQETATGGRLLQAINFLQSDKPFLFTYGDGLADVNVGALEAQHNHSGLLATVTAVRQPGRFGVIETKSHLVESFAEKPEGDGHWISGGFFILSPRVSAFIDGPQTVWEESPIQELVEAKQLGAYYHKGFWQPMDTLREKALLEDLWRSGSPPWRNWTQKA